MGNSLEVCKVVIISVLVISLINDSAKSNSL